MAKKLTPEKALEMLHNPPHGKPLTEKQRKFFGYMSNKEKGGWLDKYNDGGPVQPNYNDYSVSAGPDFEGDGYSNVGRNYSPAWGGQFQKGGAIAYADNTRVGNVPKYSRPSNYQGNQPDTLGENLFEIVDPSGISSWDDVYRSAIDTGMSGQTALEAFGAIPMLGKLKKAGQFLDMVSKAVPMTGRQAKNVKNSVAALKATGKYGPSAGRATDAYQAYDQYQMGGYMPGAVGSMYARVAGSAPSKGNKRNQVYKTDASAQDGKELQFYQQGLDFRPKSISKNGSVIKDDMGQWAHPGEITEIGSNQITMQGVPYPVMGISDTGDTQMMYPDQEYQYDGESVTEYPIMQNGGFFDPLIKLGKSAVDYVSGLFDDTTPAPVKAAPVKPKLDSYDTMIQLGYNSPQGQKLEKQLGIGSTEASEYRADKNRIKLNTGRFTGANVSSRLIDDLAEAAKRSGIPIGQLLTLAGRESTFGEDKLGHRGHLAKNDFTSGWNVAEDYTPYDPHRFLADKKVPGVNVVKTNHGYEYEVTNVNAINEYLKKNPQVFEQYKKKIAATPDIGNKNYFDLSAEFLKKKGIKGYNPGDPTYEKMFKQDYATLKKDKALMEYLKKKGYTYEDGGQLKKLDQLTNFTNYNPTQPSGWLEKYQ